MSDDKKINVLSLFDGISCARVALHRIGVSINKYYASEVDKYAIQIAQKNYPDTLEIGDVRLVNGKDFNNIDLLIGGSPCQDLSSAKGNRQGLQGSRSGLFYEYVRLRDEIMPKYFILENVNSMPKEARETITKILGVEPVMINGSLVSAQSRKRLFWVGKLVNGEYRTVYIPLPKDKNILLGDILQDSVSVAEKYFVKFPCVANKERKKHQQDLIQTIEGKGRCLVAGSHGNAHHYTKTLIPEEDKANKLGQIHDGQSGSVYSTNGKSITLSANGGGHGGNTGLYCMPSTQENVNGVNLIEGKSLTLKSQYGRNSVANITMITKIGKITGRVRRLTTIECERLMTLPDNYTFGISDTQRYKCLGNGFIVDVVAHILSHIFSDNVKVMDKPLQTMEITTLF